MAKQSIETIASAVTENFDGLVLTPDNPVLLTVSMIALSVLPFFILGVTSYVKLSVVFGLLRNALGAGQVPSAAVSMLLSLSLTLHIMSPVVGEMYAAASQSSYKSTTAEKNGLTFGELKVRAVDGLAPLKEFLRKHSRLRERVFFTQVGSRRSLDSRSLQNTAKREQELKISNQLKKCKTQAKCPLPGESLATLIPAFVLSELHEAFAIGFILFLPFLILDLVIANVLVGMGMLMVSPVTIALPFKILLFVACDGWFLLCQNLIAGYH